MIVILQKPLSEPQAKEIQDWLMMPAARLFQEHIAAKAAEACAHVGNLIVTGKSDDEQSDLDDAEKHTRAAQAFLDTNKVIDEIRNAPKLEAAELRSEMKVIETIKNPT